jgi:signal transduction histidine kinase/ActR/RegA family two-component response regulator
MEKPLFPEHEEERLQALYGCEVLDTSKELVFENLTGLIKKIFNVPIVAISLVDKHRQWFKSIQGLDVRETSRDISFCGHAIHTVEPFVIADARKDERFFDNPLVTAGPKIVFYAGIPLKYSNNGRKHQIGTLCIIDTKPRKLSSEQLDNLQSFATEVELLLVQRLERDSSVVANKAKSRFLANMSHELRTPISGVVGILDVLNKSNLDQEQRRKLELASYSAKHMLFLINEILDFSKIEAEKLKLNSAAFNLKMLFDEVRNTFDVLCAEQGNNLDVEFECKVGTNVVGDAGRLKQILNNLLSNANKFTHDGEITVNVCVQTVTDKGLRVDCVVEDTGLGISPSSLKRLFQPFEQLENQPSRRFAGTGLGLVITKRLCQLMGGDITVRSIPGKGSTFQFHVFLKQGERPTQKPAPVMTDIEKVTALSGHKILLVEDDPINRLVIEEYLHEMGINFDSFENGKQVLNALKNPKLSEQYDLIVTDCRMPEVDGYELTEMIRAGELGQKLKHIPIIALTANALIGDREKCLAAGMTEHLAKPVSAEKLKAMIHRYL